MEHRCYMRLCVTEPATHNIENSYVNLWSNPITSIQCINWWCAHCLPMTVCDLVTIHAYCRRDRPLIRRSSDEACWILTQSALSIWIAFSVHQLAAATWQLIRYMRSKNVSPGPSITYPTPDLNPPFPQIFPSAHHSLTLTGLLSRIFQVSFNGFASFWVRVKHFRFYFTFYYFHVRRQ